MKSLRQVHNASFSSRKKPWRKKTRNACRPALSDRVFPGFSKSIDSSKYETVQTYLKRGSVSAGCRQSRFVAAYRVAVPLATKCSLLVFFLDDDKRLLHLNFKIQMEFVLDNHGERPRSNVVRLFVS